MDPFQTAKRRYYRWIETEVLERLFEPVAAEPDREWIMLHAAVIRAYPQAAGALRKRGDPTVRRLAVLAASEPISTSA